MSPTATRHKIAQLSMPGMPELVHTHPATDCRSVAPGQQVLYLGEIRGGPRYGASGIIKEAFTRKAIVDMGQAGMWNIPYYFLAVHHVV